MSGAVNKLLTHLVVNPAIYTVGSSLHSGIRVLLDGRMRLKSGYVYGIRNSYLAQSPIGLSLLDRELLGVGLQHHRGSYFR